MKGNLFSGRKILLQSLRNNDNSELLHVEYFKYELAVLTKIKERRLVLEGKGDQENLQFVEENQDQQMSEQNESGMFDVSENLLKIAFESI